MLTKSLVSALVVAAALATPAAQTSPRIPPPFVSPSDVLVVGEASQAAPGWTWFVFDVSGAKTGEPDLLAYNRWSGEYVLTITDHPQFSGPNGSVVAPGDCFLSGWLPPNRDLVVADLDRDGAPDLFTYDATTGAITRYYFRSFWRCDWTDAF